MIGLRVVAAAVAVVAMAAHAADDPLPATVERIKPSIVAVGTNEPTRNPTFQFRGTGFVVGDGTLVATNAHVLPGVVDAANREVVTIAIPLAGGEAQLRQATAVAKDADHDIALLKIDGASLPPMRVTDASRVREGQGYAFTGFPIGAIIGVFPTTHHALVSAITPVALAQPSARQLDPALIRKLRADRFAIFQLDATAYPGNSGSPMYDVETGEVVAIVNSGFVKAGKESALSQPSGISYAIPSTWLSRLLATVPNGH